MNLYVGNIAYNMSPEELRVVFSPFGNVLNVKVITDKETGKSKGYAFVEFENDEDAEKALQALHNSQHKGRSLKVNHAHRKLTTV